jgi:hypothetical protein
VRKLIEIPWLPGPHSRRVDPATLISLWSSEARLHHPKYSVQLPTSGIGSL